MYVTTNSEYYIILCGSIQYLKYVILDFFDIEKCVKLFFVWWCDARRQTSRGGVFEVSWNSFFVAIF